MKSKFLVTFTFHFIFISLFQKYGSVGPVKQLINLVSPQNKIFIIYFSKNKKFFACTLLLSRKLNNVKKPTLEGLFIQPFISLQTKKNFRSSLSKQYFCFKIDQSEQLFFRMLSIKTFCIIVFSGYFSSIKSTFFPPKMPRSDWILKQPKPGPKRHI